MTFKNWIISTGRSVGSANHYEGAVYGSISKWAIESEIIDVNLAQIADPEELDELFKMIKEIPIFQERDQVGKRMYSNALKRYSEFLNAMQTELDDDLNSVESDNSISETEKENLVMSRLGQGAFRRSLFDFWNGCAVTRYQTPKMLVASHIKPWRNSENRERLDPYNGLLLIPNLDKAFDKGFISFKSSGEIILSELLQEPKKLGINDQMKIKVTEDHLIYLEYHRDVVLLNIKG